MDKKINMMNINSVDSSHKNPKSPMTGHINSTGDNSVKTTRNLNNLVNKTFNT
jgi:hypothetical protein